MKQNIFTLYSKKLYNITVYNILLENIEKIFIILSLL